MKKLVITAAAAACLVLLLSGCTKSYVGVWKCAYMDTASTRMTAGDMAQAGSELYIDLRAGGTGYMTADGETQRVTWKLSADKTSVLLTVNGQIEPFVIEGDGLVWTMDSVTVTFLNEKSDGYAEALSTRSYQSAG